MDRNNWRPAADADLWQWSWQGRTLFHNYSAPTVRIIDEYGHTVAEGQVIAYDMAEQAISLLGPRHRPGTIVRTLPATPAQIWIEG